MTSPLPAAYQGVYFYFHDGQLNAFTHSAEALASGLAALGVPVFSNIVAPELFATRSIHQPGPWLYVFVLTNENWGADYLKMISAYPARKLILSMSDANNTVFTPPDIPALVAHENRQLEISGWRLPWAFGISRQVEALTANPPPFAERRRVILRNFRPSMRQGVRNALDLALLPHVRRYFEVDDALSDDSSPALKHHHHLDYFERLKHSYGCLAYGGEFFSNLLKHKDFRNQQYEAVFSHYRFHADPVILRWDSWRFWESLAAGCLTFQLDMDLYGFALPEMPIAWQHYVPIDYAYPARAMERLHDEPQLAAQIADAGRIWAREHYSPLGVAKRLLASLPELGLG